MNIHILNIPKKLQPPHQPFKYPAHNKDYGVEQDFLIWLQKQKAVLTSNPDAADWHYLPVYWTRWHINHNFAQEGNGLQELQFAVDNAIIDSKKTFTISQFDGGTLINTGDTVLFTAARTINDGIDIPILCSPHRKPPLPVKKKYWASFNGAFNTHPLRQQMYERYLNSNKISVKGGLPTRFLKRLLWATNFNLNIMASYIALCPRGTSANSFRFFEAMQLGTVPCLIGDKDVRPFQKFIAWDEMSYYVSSLDELDRLLQTFDKKEVLQKGKRAYRFWKKHLYYQRWCKYVLMELDTLKKPS